MTRVIGGLKEKSYEKRNDSGGDASCEFECIFASESFDKNTIN